MSIINRIRSEFTQLRSWQQYRDLLLDVLTEAQFTPALTPVRSEFTEDHFDNPQLLVRLLDRNLTFPSSTRNYLYSNINQLDKARSQLDLLIYLDQNPAISWYLDFAPTEGALIDMVSYANLTDLIASADADFVRASSGLYRKGDGTFVNFTSGNPRRDASRGLLIEAAATNKFTYSADLNNAIWVAEAGITKSQPGGGPIPGQTMCRMTWASGNGRVSQQFATTAGSNIRLMAVVRGTANARYACFRDPHGTDGIAFNNYVFDLVAGTVGFQGTGSSNASIEALANGYWLIALDLTVITIGTAPSFLYVCNNPIPSNTFVAPTAGMDYYEVAYFDAIGATGKQTPIISGASVATRAADTFTLFPDADTFNITVTFDDDTTQVLSNQAITGSGWAIPTNLNGRYIKSIVATEA